MWRRLHLLLVLVRLYFALQPSYIHPDEHFQGPEVIAGQVFGYPVYKTWEFTAIHPIRSVFPFWLVYGWPLTVLKWIWEGLGYGQVPPTVAFYTLRSLMFLMSFILGDWAIHELVPAPNERRKAIMLIASSYVTCTLQTHTFSNSIETIAVLWSLVLIRRLSNHTEHILIQPSAGLAFLVVVGIFNRITFPAYLLIPLLRVLPGLLERPLRIPTMLVAGLATVAVAITMDTEFYRGYRPHVRDLNTVVFTPWNNMAYNIDAANLAQHGLHPFWQHFVANIPQLIGPAIPLLFFCSRKNMLLWSAVSGTVALSLFPHQEPRFLLPAVPLLLATVSPPRRGARYWVAVWVFFNTIAGVLFGQYHQGGVVPAQAWIGQQETVSQAFWWKTYSPPRWLLAERNHHVNTTDLMGMHVDKMIAELKQSAQCESAQNKTLLVAPDSATHLDAYTWPSSPKQELIFLKLWQYRKHIGLDDLDFGNDGVKPTMQRVVGRRGLVIWQVSRQC